jgi:hypothetical protein
MVEYDEYVRRFAEYGYQVITTREEFDQKIAELKRDYENQCNIKLKIKGPCCWQEYDVTWGGFKNKKVKQCSKCNYKALGLEMRDDYETVKEKFERFGVTLLTTKEEYDADLKVGLSRFMFKIIARCGHIRETKFFNFESYAEEYGICINCAAKKKYDINLEFDIMVNMLKDANCEMITTKDDFVNKKMNIFSEICYKGSCTHIYCEIFNDIVFKKDTICKPCREIKIMEAYDITGRLKNLIVEDEAIEWIKELLQDTFKVEIMKEGCLADIAVKPIDSTEDIWIAIQLKSATSFKKDVKSYNFSFKYKNYKDMIILCTAKFHDLMWLFKSEIIQDISGINIYLTTDSKYANSIIHPEELYEHLTEIYNLDDTIKFNLEELNKRTHQALIQEDKYQNLRKEKLSFLDFKDCQNYTITDFMLNDFKVQEKIAKKTVLQYNCNLHKSYMNKKSPYEENDNDFYWIHLDDWETFYVIPQSVLIEYGYIKNNLQDGKSHIGIYPKKYNNDNIKNIWIEEYMFEYQNLNITKLKSMFNL